jgi:nitrogen-specific signal transduction histidine kinase
MAPRSAGGRVNKVYLGDSVYVEIERGMFKLTTENGMGPSNTIFMEVEVFDAFAEYAKKVFEKFFRVPTGNRHNTKGHGLGLSYAAHVMRQHNGSIAVNNVAAGGCMFTLTF